MKTASKLKLVPNEPVDITSALRADILARDWSACHIEGDRNGVVVLLDRKVRTWRK